VSAKARFNIVRYATYGFRTDKGGVRKMARNIHAKQINRKVGTVTVSWSAVDANELKELVRDGLVALNAAEREEFIQTLEAEMRRAGFNMRAYLVPLGIPGRTPEDLTPTEVAHMIRFLKLNVPPAMPAIERALNAHDFFATGTDGNGHRIAA